MTPVTIGSNSSVNSSGGECWTKNNLIEHQSGPLAQFYFYPAGFCVESSEMESKKILFKINMLVSYTFVN